MQESDTLVAAAMLDQGSHECQVAVGGEGDLYNHYQTCNKDPGHGSFKPVDKNQLTVDCLPVGYQNDVVLQCILGLIPLVVCIVVTHTSVKRPAFESNNKKEYPFSKCKGCETMRTGTGWLRHVAKFGALENGTCTCEKCRASGSPQTYGAEFTIRTAAHVVFDSEEGAKTTIHFNFDDGLSLGCCNTLRTYCWAIRVDSDVDGDCCDMTFVTHDKSEAEEYAKLIADYRELHQKVWDTYPPKSDAKDRPSGDKLDLAIIVSHPHGCSKKVSFGQFKRRYEFPFAGKFTNYYYTTATCKGSSGAPVFILGPSRRWPWCSHPHSGNCEEDKSVNYSAIGTN
ncbi:hypothetical protein BsWGS_23256 [Bradybaena similaris]